MSDTSLTGLVEELSQGLLLNPARRKELTVLQSSFPDPRELARELIKRGWITPYQMNQLAQNRGRELVIGPYVILERLGAGGMGQVFKAHHTFLNRPVAIKLLGEEYLGSASLAERFLLEMQLVARLDHPHIVRALDAGAAGDRYYLVMELIEGPTLSHLVRQHGRLAVPHACACIRHAALGLQHAADHGLVHRDIKPSNLMLAPPKDGPPMVKVLDLGLARVQGSDSERDLTRTGAMMGTVDYLAPEQALDPRTVDVRADIYSLGCTFFFLLTGRPPFDGGTEAQKLLQHQQQEPPAIERLRPDVPPAVAAALRRMLAKRPEHRFQSPGEVAAALQPFAVSESGGAGFVPGTIAPEGPSLVEGRAAPTPGWTLMVDRPTAGPEPGPTAVATPVPTVVPLRPTVPVTSAVWLAAFLFAGAGVAGLGALLVLAIAVWWAIGPSTSQSKPTVAAAPPFIPPAIPEPPDVPEQETDQKARARYESLGRLPVRDPHSQPWSPAEIAAVAGNEHLWQDVRRRLATRRLHRNLLLEGPVGNQSAEDLPPEGALLIGFNLTSEPLINSLQPIYLTSEGEKLGNLYGRAGRKSICCRAAPGYAVGAVNARIGDFLCAMQPVFMRIKRDRLDVNDAYRSELFGPVANGEGFGLGGDGALVVGIHGCTLPRNYFGVPAGALATMGLVTARR